MGMGGAPQGTPKVSTVVAAAAGRSHHRTPGRTSAVLVADVRPQVTGILQRAKFVEGSAVKKGDLLYQIDPATYQAAVDSAEAALAKAQANQHTTRLKAGALWRAQSDQRRQPTGCR